MNSLSIGGGVGSCVYSAMICVPIPWVQGRISVPDNLSSVVDLLDLGPFNDGTPHPLHAVIQTLSYPAHALEASEPIIHKVGSTASRDLNTATSRETGRLICCGCQ